MVNELILNAVKEASKSHADLPDYEERCIEHVEKLEEFMTKITEAGIKKLNEEKQED